MNDETLGHNDYGYKSLILNLKFISLDLENVRSQIKSGRSNKKSGPDTAKVNKNRENHNIKLRTKETLKIIFL